MTMRPFTLILGMLLLSAAPLNCAETKTPKIDVGYDETGIEITNVGSPDWKTAVIYINGDPPDAFKIEVPAPAVGHKARIQLIRFIKKDGERFNPKTHGLTVIWIGGGGYDFQRYGAGG